MDDNALQCIYRVVVIAKLTYACSAWWRFPNAADRQRLNADFTVFVEMTAVVLLHQICQRLRTADEKFFRDATAI